MIIQKELEKPVKIQYWKRKFSKLSDFDLKLLQRVRVWKKVIKTRRISCLVFFLKKADIETVISLRNLNLNWKL